MGKLFSQMKRNVSVLVSSLIILLLMPSMDQQEIVKRKLDKVKVIVIDPGHGGIDPGCNGGGEIWEKEVTLAIGLKVGKLVEDSLKDVKVLYTRKTDKTLKLWERPNFANKYQADLFISIHCNANDNTKANGSETYFMGLHKTEGNLEVSKRENAVIKYESDYKDNARYGGFDPESPEGYIIFSMLQNAFLKQSFKFSTMVEEETNKKRNVKAVSQPRRNQGKRRGRVSAVEGQSPPSDIEDPRAGAEIDDLIRAKAQVELENARLHQQLLQMQEEAERPKNPPQISRQIAPVTNQAENSK
jgi:N-acetylmuramoyl-L-alanine amidase